MKKFINMSPILAVLMFFVLSGCTGMLGNISDPGIGNQIQVYISGKAMGYSINEFAEGADPELVTEWKALLEKYAGQDSIPPEEIKTFYDKSVSIISAHTPVGSDRFGFMADLKFILRLYGGSIVGGGPGDGGSLILTDPIPVIVMRSFAEGYVSGRQAARMN